VVTNGIDVRGADDIATDRPEQTGQRRSKCHGSDKSICRSTMRMSHTAHSWTARQALDHMSGSAPDYRVIVRLISSVMVQRCSS
jgi:hypothetical protein